LLGHLRDHHRRRHALPTAGPDPERAPQTRARARHARRVSVRRRVARRVAGGGEHGVTVTPDLLTVQGLRKEFGGLVAVNDVGFTIPERTIVSLIGPNGAGKTTFFNMITGVYKPTAGHIVFADTDVTGKPPHAITKLGIGRTFQNIRLFQDMTA